MRNFYVFHGQVILRAEHNKTRSLSATSRTIARFLDMETSRLWLLLVAVVRPFEVALVQAKLGTEAAQLQARNLFSSKGKALTATQIRNGISKLFREQQIYLKFSQYRHWQCGIIRLFSFTKEKPVLLQGWGPHRGYSYDVTNVEEAGKSGLDEDDTYVEKQAGFQWPNPSKSMDEQAGHTPGTADRAYAQNNLSVKGIPASRMSAFQEASKNWHEMLKIESEWKIPGSSSHFVGLRNSPPLAVVCGRKEKRRLPISENKKEAHGSDNLEENSVKRKRLDGLNSNEEKVDDIFVARADNDMEYSNGFIRARELLPSSLKTTTRRLRELDYVVNSLEHTAKARLLGIAGVPLAPIIPRKVRLQILGGLRHVLKEPNAVFSCSVQEEAIYSLLQRHRDMIVIMGTGMGKSAIFQTVCYLEGISAFADDQAAPVTIVIVPLVSLVANHLREAGTVPGIRYGGWVDRNNPEIQLLFISVEHACSAEFTRLLVKLANEMRLVRVVLDECQYALLWCSFRPSFQRLGGSIRHPSLRFQRVLLSATISPDQVGEVATLFGLVKGYQVLRQPSTARTNLSYAVHKYESKRFMKLEETMIKHSCREVRVELRRIAKSVAEHRVSYTKRNSFSVKVSDIESDGRQFVVTKQQIMLYAPLISLVDKTCRNLERQDIHRSEVREIFLSPSGSHEKQSASHVVLVVCDVMSYYSCLDSRVKERNQKRWMMSPEALYKSQSPAARRKIETLAAQILRQDSTYSASFRVGGENRNPVTVVLVQVMAATCAFGAGINSRPVRAVIHVGCSRSIVEYAQESGRGGRDGLPARCIVVYNSTFMEKIAKPLTTQVPDSVRQWNLESSPTAKTAKPAENHAPSSSAAFANFALDAQKVEKAFAEHVVWLESGEQCRRISLSQFLDDFPGAACIHDSQIMSNSPCDFCERLFSFEDSSEPESQGTSNKGVRVPFGGSDIVVKGLSSRRLFATPVVNTSTYTNHAAGNETSGAQVVELRGNPTSRTTDEVEEINPRVRSHREQGTYQNVHQQQFHSSPETQEDDETDLFGIIRSASTRECDEKAETLAEAEQKEKYVNWETILEDFKGEMDRVFLDRCVFCLATKGLAHDVDPGATSACAHKARACYRCFRKKCSVHVCQVFPLLDLTQLQTSFQESSSSSGGKETKKAKGPKPCKDCGLLYFHGKYIHTWSRFGTSCPFRGALQICLGAWYLAPSRNIIIKKFNLSEDWNTTRDIHAKAFIDWLRQMDEQGERYNFMSVFTAMTTCAKADKD